MLRNLTRRKRISGKVVLRSSVLEKATGLMFHRKLKDCAFVFKFPTESRISLHMLFVFFPIDVLFVDTSGKVVEIKERLKPFAFYTPTEKASTVIELSSGTVQEKEIHIGDKVVWE